VSDELTPPFEEPPGSSVGDCEEAVEDAAEADLYDLSQWLDYGDLLMGFTGMVKVLREDGTLVSFFVGLGINQFEAVGLHRKAIREIEEGSDMDMYWGDET